MEADLESLREELRVPLAHPDFAQIQDDANKLVSWLLQHHRTLADQPIGHNPTRHEMESMLGGPAPEDGTDFAHVLSLFQQKIAPNAFRINHPRFFAFIPGAPSWYSILGDILCEGTNFFAGVWLEGAGPTQVELTVLRWFRELLGMPKETGGILTSGGSEANLTALLVAREKLPFEDRSRAILYVSEQRHGSMDRALKIIGMRPDQLHIVPVDHHFRLDCLKLRNAIQAHRESDKLPWLVTANGGATNTGTVDALNDVADVCHDNRLWFHVDAAYGWPAMLCTEERKAFTGIERADSVTLDPHKWFAQTFEAGCVLIREGQRLPQTFTSHPDYLQDVLPGEEEVNFADHGIALTRRFRALKIWLSVKVLGIGWHRRLITHCCRLADFAELLLRKAGRFEILCPRQLSIVCFRYLPSGSLRSGDELDRLNSALVDALRKTGRAFISSTRLNGHVALRFCFVNWRSTAADVEEVVRLLADLGKQLPEDSSES